MDKPILDLIMSRLERIEKQNDDQLQLLYKHLDEDTELQKKISQHSTYFKLVGATLGAGIPILLSYLGTKLGFKP